MDYKIYKLEFLNGVHFGRNSLDSSEYTFCADTLFSALCHEALKLRKGMLDVLVDYVKRQELLISDAFPYIGKEYYLPKPLMHIENIGNKGDSVEKKKYKNLLYIPVSYFDAYLKGKFPIDKADGMKELGCHIEKVSASIRGEDESRPYRVGVYYFKEGNGLYIIAGFGSKDSMGCFEELLEAVSCSGIGGKRNSGLGRFYCMQRNVPDALGKLLMAKKKTGLVMALSVSLPKDSELEKAMEGASYLLKKRSGFVSSETYSRVQMRKRDIYVFQAGSCFQTRFVGDLYDVSSGGGHPVYRYAKPIFMEVTL